MYQHSLLHTHSTSSRVVAVILAGGMGERVGTDRPKQYIEMDGESILHHTLRMFYGMVDALVVVCSADWHSYILNGMPDIPGRPELRFAEAGATGFESLCSGIFSLTDETDDTWIMVHDAVRPLVSQGIIRDNIRVAREKGNAITAVDIYETLLYAPEGDGVVQSMRRRENMFRAQTPQTFTLGTFRKMILEARKFCIHDAQSVCTLAHQLGYELHISRGDLSNFKITTPSDLELYRKLK